MRNQTSFRLTTTLLPTDTTAKTTQVINKVDADGNQFYPTFSEETVVLTNDDRTIMETTRASCNNGVLTFVKRGLSDDNTETQVANRKLTWNPGTIAFITVGASDMIDIDDDLTWTGKQTYSNDMTSNGKATYNGLLETKKGVKYPNFASTTCLNAYDSPFGGMFATVDDTGELYRYNAVTCCWDMVSSVSLGTYEIRESQTAPDACTADTIVTIADTLGEIYLGTTKVAELNSKDYYADILVVGGGGGGGSAYDGGGGGGAFIEQMGVKLNSTTLCATVGAGGTSGGNGCDSSFNGFIANGGGGHNSSHGNASGGGADFENQTKIAGGMYGFAGGCAKCIGCGAGGGGGGAGGQGSDGEASNGGAGGAGKMSAITGCVYAGGGGGGGNCGNGTGGIGSSCCGGGGTRSCGECGIVAVRYPSNGDYGYCCATGGTVTCCCGYITHTFTSDGTFCIVS